MWNNSRPLMGERLVYWTGASLVLDITCAKRCDTRYFKGKGKSTETALLLAILSQRAMSKRKGENGETNMRGSRSQSSHHDNIADNQRASSHLRELLRAVPEKGRVHVASRLTALHHLAEAVEVELPLEAAELIVCAHVGSHHTRREKEQSESTIMEDNGPCL